MGKEKGKIRTIDKLRHMFDYPLFGLAIPWSSFCEDEDRFTCANTTPRCEKVVNNKHDKTVCYCPPKEGK